MSRENYFVTKFIYPLSVAILVIIFAWFFKLIVLKTNGNKNHANPKVQQLLDPISIDSVYLNSTKKTQELNDIDETSISQDAVVIEKIPVKNEVRHINNKINNNGRIGTIINNNNNGKVIINNDLRDYKD